MNKATLTADRPLKVKVGKSDAGKTVLTFSDGQKVVVNDKFIPSDAREDDMLYLDLLTWAQYNRTKEEVAREVLKEILEPEDGKTRRRAEG